MTKSINLLIIEDEKHARDKLKHFIKQLELDSVEVREAEHGQEALHMINEQAPQVIIADIHMPHLSGLECVRKIGEESRPLVIFTTAYEEYAIKAFEVNAVDYLLKPFSFDRFSGSIKRVIDQLTLRQVAKNSQENLPTVGEEAELSTSEISYVQRLRVESSSKAQTFLSLDEVHLIKSAGNYCEFFTRERSYLRRETLKNLEASLSPSQFLRLNRSEIVRIECIQSVKVIDHGDAIVRLNIGSQHRWSRHYRSENGDLFEI